MNVDCRTIHGVAFLLGETGILVVGASGAGKSSFMAGVAAAWRFDPVRLVADDRVRVAVAGGRLIARPVAGFLGKIELRGIGIADASAMPSAVIGALVALESGKPPRMPEQDIEIEELFGIGLPLLRLPQGQEAIPAFITKWPYFHARVTGV